jgi:Flp pilus assembly protein TadG
MNRLAKLLARLDDRGVSTLEFAIVLPPFLLIVIGGMHLSMLGFAAASLRFAAEDAARCGAIQTTRCTSTAVTQTHALSKFRNITGATATFTAQSGLACGYRVQGSVTYTVQTGFSSLPVPLTSTACYPT